MFPFSSTIAAFLLSLSHVIFLLLAFSGVIVAINFSVSPTFNVVVDLFKAIFSTFTVFFSILTVWFSLIATTGLNPTSSFSISYEVISPSQFTINKLLSISSVGDAIQ